MNITVILKLVGQSTLETLSMTFFGSVRYNSGISVGNSFEHYGKIRNYAKALVQSDFEPNNRYSAFVSFCYIDDNASSVYKIDFGNGNRHYSHNNSSFSCCYAFCRKGNGVRHKRCRTRHDSSCSGNGFYELADCIQSSCSGSDAFRGFGNNAYNYHFDRIFCDGRNAWRRRAWRSCHKIRISTIQDGNNGCGDSVCRNKDNG